MKHQQDSVPIHIK